MSINTQKVLSRNSGCYLHHIRTTQVQLRHNARIVIGEKNHQLFRYIHIATSA